MIKNPLRVSKGGKGGGGGGAEGGGGVPQMPKGWQEYRTKEGAYYYHCAARGITTWTKPPPVWK